MKHINNLIFFIFSLSAQAKVDRISDIEFDISKPQPLYMAPGRSTVVDFPCEIEHTILGLHNDIRVEVGPNSSKSIIIWLSNDFSQSTNLIIRCDRKVFVLDVIPSVNTHQDYLRVVDYLDQRNLIFINKELISNSKNSNKSSKFEIKEDKTLIIPKKIKLISSSAKSRN